MWNNICREYLEFKYWRFRKNRNEIKEVCIGEGKKVVRERIKRTKRVGKRVVKCNLKKGETSSRLPFHPWEEGKKEGRKLRLVYNSARIRQLFRTLPTKPLYHLVTVATPPVWFRELRRGTSSSQTTAHTPTVSFTTFITMHRSANIAPLLSPSPAISFRTNGRGGGGGGLLSFPATISVIGFDNSDYISRNSFYITLHYIF